MVSNASTQRAVSSIRSGGGIGSGSVGTARINIITVRTRQGNLTNVIKNSQDYNNIIRSGGQVYSEYQKKTNVSNLLSSQQKVGIEPAKIEQFSSISDIDRLSSDEIRQKQRIKETQIKTGRVGQLELKDITFKKTGRLIKAEIEEVPQSLVLRKDETIPIKKTSISKQELEGIRQRTEEELIFKPRRETVLLKNQQEAAHKLKKVGGFIEPLKIKQFIDKDSKPLTTGGGLAALKYIKFKSEGLKEQTKTFKSATSKLLLTPLILSGAGAVRGAVGVGELIVHPITSISQTLKALSPTQFRSTAQELGTQLRLDPLGTFTEFAVFQKGINTIIKPIIKPFLKPKKTTKGKVKVLEEFSIGREIGKAKNIGDIETVGQLGGNIFLKVGKRKFKVRVSGTTKGAISKNIILEQGKIGFKVQELKRIRGKNIQIDKFSKPITFKQDLTAVGKQSPTGEVVGVSLAKSLKTSPKLTQFNIREVLRTKAEGFPLFETKSFTRALPKDLFLKSTKIKKTLQDIIIEQTPKDIKKSLTLQVGEIKTPQGTKTLAYVGVSVGRSIKDVFNKLGLSKEINLLKLPKKTKPSKVSKSINIKGQLTQLKTITDLKQIPITQIFQKSISETAKSIVTKQIIKTRPLLKSKLIPILKSKLISKKILKPQSLNSFKTISKSIIQPKTIPKVKIVQESIIIPKITAKRIIVQRSIVTPKSKIIQRQVLDTKIIPSVITPIPPPPKPPKIKIPIIPFKEFKKKQAKKKKAKKTKQVTKFTTTILRPIKPISMKRRKELFIGTELR